MLKKKKTNLRIKIIIDFIIIIIIIIIIINPYQFIVFYNNFIINCADLNLTCLNRKQ